jgi:hypothetical protein
MAKLDQELEQLAITASGALQQIQTLLDRKKNNAGKVQFPRGYLRSAAQQRRLLPKIGTTLKRQNASYSLMLADTLRWIAIRTDLSGPSLGMLVKEAICIYGAILDWLLKEVTYRNGSRRSFAYRTQKCIDLGIIDQDLKDELDWVWGLRCNEHFHEVTESEIDMYGRADHNRARKAFVKLCMSIKQHLGEDT